MKTRSLRELVSGVRYLYTPPTCVGWGARNANEFALWLMPRKVDPMRSVQLLIAAGLVFRTIRLRSDANRFRFLPCPVASHPDFGFLTDISLCPSFRLNRRIDWVHSLWVTDSTRLNILNFFLLSSDPFQIFIPAGAFYCTGKWSRFNSLYFIKLQQRHSPNVSYNVNK